jgi:hypothetical protein
MQEEINENRYSAKTLNGNWSEKRYDAGRLEMEAGPDRKLMR